MGFLQNFFSGFNKKELMNKFSENGINEQKKYDSEKIIPKIKLLINNIIENKSSINKKNIFNF